MAAAAPISAEDAPPINRSLIRTIDQPFTKLEVVEKSSQILEFKGRISTVDVGDGDVITATKVENPFNPHQLRLSANMPGVTDVTIVDEFGQSHKIEILVVGDVRHLQSLLRLSFPDTVINVTKVQNTAVLSGWVDQPSQIHPIMKMTEQFFPEPINNIQVGGVQQVTLKVKIMEVQRGKIRRLGFNFFWLGQDGFLISNPGNLIPIDELAAAAGSAANVGFDPSGTTAMFGIIGNNSIFQGFIEALKQESLLKILAEPNLTVKSGERANLLQGGEFPILVPQSLGTLSVEFKSFGVKLEALPIVLGNGRLSLQLIPEVSERDFSSAIETQGIIVPGLTTRRVQTAVEMEFGQTFAIAGLIFDRQTASTFKVPLLGELPVVGSLFRRVRYDQTETELLVMVTPELADPLRCEQVPPKGPGEFTTFPTDRELYLDGAIEIPSYGPECFDCPVDGGYCPPQGLIQPTYDNGSNYAPAVVPPAPAAAPMVPPPSPAPEASNRSTGTGPSLGQSTTQPGLISPRFGRASSLPQRRSISAAAPAGATPYRPSSPNLVPPTQSTPAVASPVSRAAAPTNTAPAASATTPAKQSLAAAPRAKTLNQTRANRRTGTTQVVQQQQTNQTDGVTMVRRASSTVPAEKNAINPALAFPDANKQELLKHLNQKTRSTPTKRSTRSGLIAPAEFGGPSPMSN